MKVDQIKQAAPAQPVQKTDAERGSKNQSARSTADEVSISTSARSLHLQQKQVDKAEEAMGNTPAVRADRIEAVTRRIAEGYYNRPEVIDKIAGAVVQSGVLDDALQARTAVTTVLKQIDRTADVRQDRVEKARQNIQAGVYNRPEVIEKVAEEILRNFEQE
jgi:anti-sigma28 factor (negative regulator of flagellin synthesis)